MEPPPIHLRPATEGDAEGIAALLNPYVAPGLVLPRSPDEIRRAHADFLVAERGREIVGCVALRDYGDGLAEVRSLVVRPDLAGVGLGSRLATAAADLATARGYSLLFALTLRPHLFERLGFTIVPRESFPQKVWTDCVRCPKRECCDEIALLRELRPIGERAP